MLAGAAIGFFTGGIGYVALGASLGGMVGSAIDPPKGPDIVGPRLEDLSVQTSTYGAPLARAAEPTKIGATTTTATAPAAAVEDVRAYALNARSVALLRSLSSTQK